MLVAPDDLGTYEIRVEQDNMAICFSDGSGCSNSKSNDPDEGITDSYLLKVCKDATMTDCELSPASELCAGRLARKLPWLTLVLAIGPFRSPLPGQLRQRGVSKRRRLPQSDSGGRR